MTLQKKEKLFIEVRAQLWNRCYLCGWMEPGFCDLPCEVSDEWGTAILSLDKKENWPEIFKGE